MATLDSLKNALRRAAKDVLTAPPEPLSSADYKDFYSVLRLGLENSTYDKFIVPQLSSLLRRFELRSSISVLEIGPGPSSVLAQIPYYTRRIITKYTAFEPNDLYRTSLEACLRPCGKGASPLPCLESQPDIRPTAFTADEAPSGKSNQNSGDEQFDLILFCHSMYGMKPKNSFVARALGMLSDDGIAIVFHRGEGQFFENLACHRTAVFPTGVASVENENQQLDRFASFIAGFQPPNTDAGQTLASQWRTICRRRASADRQEPNYIFFSSPVVMVAFTANATELSSLVARVPVVQHKKIKNRDAGLQQSAAHTMPRDIEDLTHCVLWAIGNGLQLSIVSGSHSDHCIRSNVIAVDMGNFNEVNVVQMDQEPMHLVIAGSGCKSVDIIRKSMEKSLVVPLGARPSIGSGLWLQGGIGHLTRQHGLTCDAIVGAVLVTVNTAEVIFVGNVPQQYRPSCAVRATNEAELLWGLKGAGTNFGIVVYVVFKAFPASTTGVRTWSYSVNGHDKAKRELAVFEESVTKNLPTRCSADVYLQYNAGKFHLSGAVFERQSDQPKTPIAWPPNNSHVLDSTWQSKDAMELFDADLYMTNINGGHESGKTSSFKRCIFLQDIKAKCRAAVLVRAFDSRPSDFCYLHLLHGGGAANDVEAEHSAFGCRGWGYACVITAVWPRESDDTQVAHEAKRWVHRVAKDLLPLSMGVYGADLGPDPRDVMLTQRAFGPNLARLTKLKEAMDPVNVLAFACPLPKKAIEQKLVIIVTGDSGAGKDYCAEIWASVFFHQHIATRIVSISDATKIQYARTTGADFYRLRHDREYKEEHRERLLSFFQDQRQKQPRLPEAHFQAVVDGADDVDVLLITGMRDRAPVATLSHLVPDRKLIEVYVTASKSLRQFRKRCGTSDCSEASKSTNEVTGDDVLLGAKALGHCPDFVFDNSTTGEWKAESFAMQHLLPMMSNELGQLADMIRTVPNFPRQGIAFRHVLNIPQQRGGLAICTSLLQSHFGDWTKVDAVVSCEAGGFIYGSALALQADIPMVTVRKAGKLPPPTISVSKTRSHISSQACSGSDEDRIEMGRDALPSAATVVVVDDVLATGRTLLAVLHLLKEAGIGAENVCALVVAEFPLHCGRALLCEAGFGMVRVQSLLVFQGA